MKSDEPFLRDLLLIGGGHAHVQVLRKFGMKPEPGVRLTLVSRESESPYTGMLPGYIANEYEREAIVIDLLRLCRFANCRFIEGNVKRVDIERQQVHFDSERVPLRYDTLSLNTGGDCTLQVPGGEFVEPIKPIGRFVQSWPTICADLLNQSGATIAVIGGGAGSVEFALALRQRLGLNYNLQLITRAPEIVGDHGDRVHRHLEAALAKHRIEIVVNFEVKAVERLDDGSGLVLRSDGDDNRIECTHAFSVTGVFAPSWVQHSGFKVDADGFLAVNQHLQSESAPSVFGAGDLVSITDRPRTKAGVYSVRAGPVLAENLRRQLIGQPLKIFRPQQSALALVRTESGMATASRSIVQSSGRWWWRVKDHIDRRFMRRFQDLPTMVQPSPNYRGALRATDSFTTMRCGGCGAKLGADLLTRVLHRLDIHTNNNISVGVGDDAAVVNFGNSTVVLSCDGFRSMLDDPWLFGRIAAHHALNDLFAMNSVPSYALALVTVPFMHDALMEEDLFQVMSGALSVLQASGTNLVGGHSAEGKELSLGFTVAGSAGFDVMTKDRLLPGYVLVLTKPLGVGALLAGAMDGRVSAMGVAQAIEVMDVSNLEAMRTFADYGVQACTDVTGFGLGGHLAEMLRASSVSATLRLDTVPFLPDALAAMGNGIESSLQANNEQVIADWSYECSSLDPRLRLLADPQTSGGLLAGVHPDYAEDCIALLRAAGYQNASVIGWIDDAKPDTIGKVTILS